MVNIINVINLFQNDNPYQVCQKTLTFVKQNIVQYQCCKICWPLLKNVETFINVVNFSKTVGLYQSWHKMFVVF